MHRFAIAALLALTSGCNRTDPQEQARADARDVAMVEKAQAQIPPVVPLRPEPVTMGEIDASQMAGAGCAFIPKPGAAAEAVVYTNSQRAVIKIDGQLIPFASDSGSGELPYATRDHYVGKTHDMRLRKDPGEGMVSGEEAMRWPASIVITDRWRREVYASPGDLECGA